MSPGWPASVDRSRFVDYFEAQGKHPFEAGGLVWFETRTTFFQSFPFHVAQFAEEVPLREVFARPRVVAARFPQRPQGNADARRSALWIRRRRYSPEQLSSNTRSKIRRGLKATRIEQLDFRVLRQRATPLLASTASRQRVAFGSHQASSFQRMCEAAQSFPALEAWGAFVDGAFAAFAICFQVEDCFQISTVRSDSALLKSYPNNALIHTLMERGWQRPGVSSVCYGMASLDRGTQGLNEFKRSAGFDPEEIDDVIVGRLPLLVGRAASAGLQPWTSRSHRIAQLATIGRTVSWWKRQG